LSKASSIKVRISSVMVRPCRAASASIAARAQRGRTAGVVAFVHAHPALALGAATVLGFAALALLRAHRTIGYRLADARSGRHVGS
jgi:hypothetical protein